MGTPTNGTCPKNCTHHRKEIFGGRCSNNGMTISDITSQIDGP
jgi:hypothetical protein